MAERLVGRKEYQGFYKDNEGEAHVVNMESRTLEPEVDLGSFITQAKPTQVRATRRKRPTRSDTVTLAFGDAQIPFQDERAMGLALTAIQEVQPDNVLLLGDMLDLSTLSKYPDASRQEWAGQMQGSLDRYHLFLAEIRARHMGRLAVIHGNHEERLPKFLRKDAAELVGLRRANAGKELGILTIQYLARYDELQVESITGYPNGTLWLEDNLQAIHGTETKRQGQSAVNYLRKEQVSTLYGHDHRLAVAWQTRNTRMGGVACVAASPGCLARTDGYVPGVHYTTAENGSVVPRSEDWQQGGILVLHNERNHDVQPLRISEQGINIGDKYYGN